MVKICENVLMGVIFNSEHEREVLSACVSISLGVINSKRKIDFINNCIDTNLDNNSNNTNETIIKDHDFVERNDFYNTVERNNLSKTKDDKSERNNFKQHN